jgi:protein SCO1/2
VTRAIALVCVLFAMTVRGAAAHELSPDQVRGAGLEEHLGVTVPLDLTFEDEDGANVTLETYVANQKPVLLSFNYFHCQYVCPLEEDGLISALNGVKPTLGQDFTLLTISIDPNDTPVDATAVKGRALRGYDRPQGADGWHLLTGQQTNIQRLTDAVGFHYVADPDQGDFAHPIGVVALTPSGQISRYFSGLDFSAGDLQSGLQQASGSQLGSLLNAVMICYQYDPLSGRYTPLALNLVRIAGGLGFVAVAVWLGWLWRGELRGRTA